MRMGNTFSGALDPSKALLFGYFPLDILKEEVWDPTAARLSWQNPMNGKTHHKPTEAVYTETDSAQAEDSSVLKQQSGM